MKILLLGDASNFHWTLSQGLRQLGHQVTVVSNGGGWMSTNCDIAIRRKSYGPVDSMMYLTKIMSLLPSWRNYDVVQIAGHGFFSLRPEKNLAIFRQLRRQNERIFMEALATDHYYTKACFDGTTYRYSDYFVGDKPLNRPNYNKEREAYLEGANRDANIAMAEECNGIAACLWEYYVAYEPEFAHKLTYIPIPINLDENPLRNIPDKIEQLRFFIGIQHDRSILKGTDVMYDVLKQLQKDYKNECHVTAVESLPYKEYNRVMYESDVLIDQLYSYTPATNALLAMAKGIVAVSGAEPEYCDFIGAHDLQPVVNVLPDADAVYRTLEDLILHRERIPQMCRDSRLFVEQHHDYRKVAQQFVDFWSK
ncbi:MAG: glycosyltransferase family 1 protein [Muribaculaceae bacterium]|nr:glycosyltransferase family 1 protein [Muribaculaceae bacterium]